MLEICLEVKNLINARILAIRSSNSTTSVIVAEVSASRIFYAVVTSKSLQLNCVSVKVSNGHFKVCRVGWALNVLNGVLGWLKTVCSSWGWFSILNGSVPRELGQAFTFLLSVMLGLSVIYDSRTLEDYALANLYEE
ncbi:uncharacterized protein LOC128280743 [Gossypium arboreum]|uniref:uncharacterized protein LOC128280743 n=1 Tax=Gossypium arboreum TaxID=29729 RepID=UPI0022F1D05D|nr:uncharacterized protein LOC128280743 [Gossypium arboreum]